MSRQSQTEVAVLGALSVEPMSGYAARRAITETLGHFWSESFGQIYPTLASLARAAAGGVLDAFNALLGELSIVLFPHGDSITRMSEYALESRTFYRGIKSVWWSIAEAAVASGEKGTVLVGRAEVEAAIGRVTSGSAGGAGEKAHLQEDSFEAQTDADTESNGAGG